MDATKQIKEAIRAIDKLKRELESTRAHAQDPRSMDYVYVKMSGAVKELDKISTQLTKALTNKH
jgi:hypothetical protein